MPTADQNPTRVEWALALAVLILMTKAVIMLALTKGDPLALGLAEGSLLFQVLAALAYLSCGVILVTRHGPVLELLARNKLLIALIVVALLSVAWSVSPAVTLRRVIGLLGTIIVATFIATRFSLGAFLRLLQAMFLVLALLSLVAVVVSPELAIDSDVHAGAWRGVFAHKNNLGEAMAMGVTLSALLLSQKGVKGRALVGLLSCGILLAFSASRASWVAAAGALLAIYAVRVFSLSFWLRIPVLLTLITTGIVAGTTILLNLERLLALVGRDLTLTGRTVLWASAMVAGLERPWFGHGYRAFWLGESGGVASLGAGASTFAMQIDHGHNGFLDVWLELGLVGLVLFVVLFVVFAARSLLLARSASTVEHRWPLVLCVLMLPVSFATTVVLDRNNYYWIIFVATLLYVSRSSTSPRPLRGSARLDPA